MNRYLLITCYECEISTYILESYKDVENELKKLSFDDETISKIMTGDTFNDWDECGQVKVQRINV